MAIISVSVAVAMTWFLPALSFAGLVTDQLGRKVDIPDHANRIVSLAPNITEIIYALGQQHRLVGVSRFSDYPPEATRLPKVGSYVYLDLERIVGLKPDLCIAVKDGNPIAVIDRLVALNIPVYAVDPRDLEAVIDTIGEIGRLLDAGQKAEALSADLRYRLQRVKNRVARAVNRPGVFFQIGISPIVSVGSKTFIHRLIEDAGGRNLTQGDTPYPRLSREQVIALAPEIMIITSMETAGASDTLEKIQDEWRQWQEIPAVRNRRIYLVDSNLFDRATPRLIDALETLAPLIHPELYAKELP